VLDVAGGLLVAAIAGFARPWAWPLLLSAALCFAAFGAWGIADRELTDRGDASPTAGVRLLRALRLVAIAVGTAAAVTLLLTALGIALGSVRS
jgi:hypothetical protein